MLPNGRRGDPDQLPLGLGRGIGPAPDEEQDAPWLRVARDRAGDLEARLVRGREVIRRVRVDHARRFGECGAEDAERARELDERLPGRRRRTRSGPGGPRPVARRRRAPAPSASRIASTAAWSGASGLARASRIADPLIADSSPTRPSIAWWSSSATTAPRRRPGAGRSSKPSTGGRMTVASLAARKRCRSPMR